MELCLDGRSQAVRSVVALGMFDGVHIGHCVLLRRAKALSRQLNAPMVVHPFTTHPLARIRPEQCPPMLTTLNERARLIEKQGADILNAAPFDEATRALLPEEFIGRLVRQWHPAAVVVGYNYTFGREGRGTAAWLAALGGGLGFTTEIVPEIRLEGAAISSSRIRALLTQGDAAMAARLLGRPYARQAEAVGGAALVLQPNGKLIPGAGRYRALLDTEGRSYPVTLRLDGDGHASYAPTAPIPPRGEVTLRFLSGERG